MQDQKKLEQDIDKTIEGIYLDYFNNFLTIEAFANHYGFTLDGAKKVIDIGRKINQGDK